MKAKRSLTSSFDQLLKRKGSRDDLAHNHIETPKSTIVKELSLPMNAALCKVNIQRIFVNMFNPRWFYVQFKESALLTWMYNTKFQSKLSINGVKAHEFLNSKLNIIS